MATYMISFRINGDSDYSDRWSSTVSAIRGEAIDGIYWEETTSLIVLKSVKSADSLASSIFIGSKFNSTKDTLLVVNSSNGSYATRGEIEYPVTLAGLFSGQTAVNARIG